MASPQLVFVPPLPAGVAVGRKGLSSSVTSTLCLLNTSAVRRDMHQEVHDIVVRCNEHVHASMASDARPMSRL